MRITQYSWYDAWWLAAFAEARAVIAKTSPAVLDGFLAAVEPLRTSPDFEPVVVDDLLPAPRLEEVKAQIRAPDLAALDADGLAEARRFGRYITRNVPYFSALQRDLTPIVSRLAGEPVEPTYNFLSLYGAPGVCEPHIDAPCAKWTLDICLNQSGPWPIYFSEVVPWPEGDRPPDLSGLSFAPVVLEPGQAVLFSGSSQWHYREPMPGAGGVRFCDLLFLHYVPAGSREVSRPQNWARMFGVPELEGLGGATDEFI